MATKTKSKSAKSVRPSSGKGGRRPNVKAKAGRDLPLLPFAVLGALVLLAIGMIIFVVVNNRPTPAPATVAGIPCDQLEHTQIHYHAALQIIYEGHIVNLPANIGISGDPSNPTCYYWLHVHPANVNTIHIESPASDTFTLGQFFAVWSAWSQANGGPAQPLDATHVSTLPPLTAGQTLAVYIDLNDTKGPQPYTGNPRDIVLKSHEVISLVITPPATTPPSFSFASGL